jgi:hypothetical protein
VSFCLFIVCRDRARPAARITAGEHAQLDAVLRTVPRLARALVHTPAHAHDPFLDDGAPPQLALQLYFDALVDLEAAARSAGPLRALAGALLTLAGAAIEQEAMAARAYATQDRARPAAAGDPCCTYLVAYEGQADDPDAWLDAYLAHHPALMARLPGIREIEIYTRLDWVSGLPWPRARCMQRNKVVFDNAAALTAALESPVRQEMRAHFHALPTFTGRVTHFPMATRALAMQAKGR